MKKIRNLFTVLFLLSLVQLAFPIFADGMAQPKEFRGMWVSTVFNLDYPASPTTDAAALMKEADSILDNCKEMGMNAVILQVRPSSDALYPSRYFPWSKYLTGVQGTPPSDGFDPLAYWVTAAHARGIQLHAWINPFRITKSSDADYAALTADHPAKLHPDWVMKAGDGNYYFNPAIPEVRQLIVDGAMEIAKNYDVDGIHMDDYFYPEASFDDAAQFAQYGTGFANIADWRRDNINQLIRALDENLHKIKPNISFGISPAGIWANRSAAMPQGSATRGNESYSAHYADTRKWVKEGWVDYICPQIYWEIGNAVADYRTLANWWADTVRGTGVKLYIGMADYRTGNKNSSAWYGIDAITDAIDLNATIPEITGEVHFRYGLVQQSVALKQYYASAYGGKVEMPETPTTPEQPEILPVPEAPAPTPMPAIPKLDRINHNAYMQGDNGLFRPTANLTRAEAVTLFARLIVDDGGDHLFDESENYPTDFKDVKSGEWYAAAVGFVAQYGIVTGYEDGTFRPNAPISRMEFTIIASRLSESVEGGKQKFSDVPNNFWAADYINYAAAQGWVSGYPDGTFGPTKLITRAEAVKIVNAMLDRRPTAASAAGLVGVRTFSDVPNDYWAAPDILEATNGHEYTRDANGMEKWTDLK